MFARASGRATAIALLSMMVAGADWPGFRGPEGNGIVSDAAAPLTWSDSKGVVWKTRLPGPGASSPVVSDGRVFVSCYFGYGLDRENPGDPQQLQREAVCLNLADGEILWSHRIAETLPDAPFSGDYIPLHGYASSTPAVDGDRVFYFFGKSGVVALSTDGKLLWQTRVGDDWNAWGTGSSPLVVGDLVYINASLESDALVALNKQTGEVVWRVTGFQRAWNTPVLVELPRGGRELVLNSSGWLRAFDPTNGKELWRCQAIRAAELCPSVVAHEGVVYVLGSPQGNALAVRAGGRGDVTDTHLLWKLAKGSNVTSPVYYQGHLYWTNDRRGAAYCVDAKTGNVVYEERIAPRPDRIYASPILVGDRLYYVSRNHGTFIVQASPRYKLLAHNTLAADTSVFNASPALVDGKLLLRSDEYLYCIE